VLRLATLYEKKLLMSKFSLQRCRIICIREKTVLVAATPAAQLDKMLPDRSSPQSDYLCNSWLAAASMGSRQKIQSLSPTIGKKLLGAAKITIG